jgi:hypothetical protein
MNVGPIIRPRQLSLGAAMAVRGKPPIPQRPNRRTGSMNYREGHPSLMGPAIPAALPVRAIAGGVNQMQLAAYLKSLRGK